MPLERFHPVIQQWFHERYAAPTEPQRLGWPATLDGRHTLIAAPTGSGKTLTAFLACLDSLVRQSIGGELTDETQVVYVSPLKALSNDIRRNLETPLAEIEATALAAGYPMQPIRAVVRTGDTPASERQAMLRRPPHILVTTPESLFLLVTGAKSREKLRSVRTVIVDEIHALARDKRGSHLALTLERLDTLLPRPATRIGLSATQRPIDEIARFLLGTQHLDARGEPQAEIIDVGHVRQLDLAVEVPPTELSAVCSNEQWLEIYGRLIELIQSHRSTLVFVNTRRMAERVAHQLAELLGEDAVASHHGSLSREIRLSAEERLKSGQLRAIVATASLELGIDVGYIDLVCQIGSARAIATALQRIGRAGHSLGAVPKGRLFPLSRDDLMECLALIRAIRARRLDRIEIPDAPLDILAQQIVAAVACEPWDEEPLFELMRRAWPFRNLTREKFDKVVRMLSEGIARGKRKGTYLHRDAIHRQLHARRGARLAALTSGGAIPETADYRVVTVEEDTFVGTVNEDFAIESLAGDVFLLGNNSWRICYVRGGEVTVEDAHGAPATIPFWLGEAPGRTIELSDEISRLRVDLAERVRGEVAAAIERVDTAVREGDDLFTPRPTLSYPEAVDWLRHECGAPAWAAEQAAHYVAVQQAAIGLVPTRERIVFERFFDESGGMQMVIHSPLGARINRAWGLAMRKRFCRSFDFELQASADDNGIVLSLGPQHSFPLEQMFGMLNTRNGEPLLIQAMLAVPMFQVRWRWNATRALAVLRSQGGKKVPPPLQRFRADDLLTAVFPASTQCLEHIVGDIELPDHPLVNQTVYDCLHEAMDLPRWLGVLGDIEAGRIELVARDTREPSPFCYEILNANPYAFLDDAPLEERRARAVATRRTLSVDALSDLGRLDCDAIAQVRAEAWPIVRDAEEMHDALLVAVAIPAAEGTAWEAHFSALVARGRAAVATIGDGRPFWIAAESWPQFRALHPDATLAPALALPADLDRQVAPEEATLALLRGRLDVSGPATASEVAELFALRESAVLASLEALEAEGFVLRGHFTPPDDAGAPSDGAAPEIEWCERRLLARIHRLTLDGARRQIQPVDQATFLRFLVEHQHLAADTRLDGRGGVREIVSQLEGFELPAGAWEGDILSARVRDYDTAWLDELSLTGNVVWGRLQPPQKADDAPPSGSTITRVVPIALVAREDLDWLLPPERGMPENFARGGAQAVLEALRTHGALFPHDLTTITSMLPSQVEDALGELAALGLVTADGFAPIRRLVETSNRREQLRRRRAGAALRRRRTVAGDGRWSRFPAYTRAANRTDRAEHWARLLLRRWGVVFRDLLTRENGAPPWRELAMVYRRLEARGEIRGGRFIRGVAGEQFAQNNAVTRLRRLRDEAGNDRWIALSAADPLNLIGIITPGPRLPATRTNAFILRGGQVVATLEGGAANFTAEVAPTGREAMHRAMRLADHRHLPEEIAEDAAHNGSSVAPAPLTALATAARAQ
ncbi:MAG: DEAD/DEAH box helicase [Pirellulales bacterium]|nr:DEAD/DEAH box helicase [Pirellulales bacterium]